MTAEAVIANEAPRARVHSLSARAFAQLLSLNLAISLALALGFWATGRGSGHSLVREVWASLIHGAVYGSVFGLAVAFLSEALAHLRRPWNVISIMAAIAVAAATGTFLIQCFLSLLGYFAPAQFWPEFAYKTVVVTILASLIGWGIHVYESVQTRLQSTRLKLRAEEFEKERALNLAREAQLASLESKLHPHFLFNTLNSISALISEEPATADKIVLRLARVLRSSLDALQQSSVPLDQEIKLAVDYLEIEKARFGDRLRYSLDLDPNLGAVRVPPLILQPLLENSVKFAVCPRPGGGEITIVTGQCSGSLIIAVQDDGPSFTADAITDGHGLDVLRRRLQTLFRENAALTISNGQEEKSVTVSMAFSALGCER